MHTRTHHIIQQLNLLSNRRWKRAFNHPIDRLDHLGARCYKQRREAVRETIHKDIRQLLQQPRDGEDLRTANSCRINHTCKSFRAARHEITHRAVDLKDHRLDERIDVNIPPRHHARAEPCNRCPSAIKPSEVKIFRVVIPKRRCHDRGVTVIPSPLHELRELL